MVMPNMQISLSLTLPMKKYKPQKIGQTFKKGGNAPKESSDFNKNSSGVHFCFDLMPFIRVSAYYFFV